MERFHFCHMTLCLVALACLSASAQESKLKLPDDGWWATYSIRHSATNGSGKLLLERTKIQTVSFVGTFNEADEVCRWVEVKTVTRTDGMESTYIEKKLISEKDLLEGEQPFNKFKRGWTKGVSGIREAKVKQGRQAFDTPTIYFPGGWRMAEEIAKERVVDYQRGQLKIAKARTLRTTPLEWSESTGKNPINMKEIIDYTLWSDPATTPLVSAVTIQAKYYRNDELNTTHDEDIELQNFGTGAKSELPEHY